MIIRPASRKDCQVIYSLYQSEKWLSFTEEKSEISIFNKSVSLLGAWRGPENPWLCPLSDGWSADDLFSWNNYW